MKNIIESRKMELAFERDPLGMSGVKVWMYFRGARDISVAEPPTFRALKEGEEPSQPTLIVSDESVREWVESIQRFDQGLRTDSDHRIGGTLEATRAHLADMQRLVFKKGKR